MHLNISKPPFSYDDFVCHSLKLNPAPLKYWALETTWRSSSLCHSMEKQVAVTPGAGGGGTPLQEANGNVPLDGAAFSPLEWLWWGRIFNRFTRTGSHDHIFGFFGVTQFFIFTVSKRTRMFVLQMKSRGKVFFIQSKKWSIHKCSKWLSWDRKITYLNKSDLC